MCGTLTRAGHIGGTLATAATRFDGQAANLCLGARPKKVLNQGQACAWLFAPAPDREPEGVATMDLADG